MDNNIGNSENLIESENGSYSKVSNHSKIIDQSYGISLLKSIKNIKDNQQNLLKIPIQNFSFRKAK